MIASVKAREIEIEQKDALQAEKWQREDEVHPGLLCSAVHYTVLCVR